MIIVVVLVLLWAALIAAARSHRELVGLVLIFGVLASLFVVFVFAASL